MKKRSILKTILYVLGSITVAVAIAIWVFLSFYFEGTLNTYVVPRLTEAVKAATHGKYNLAMGRISYSTSIVSCKNFILTRVGYDSSEHGSTLMKISIDSVRFVGVNWWDAIWDRDLQMTTVEMNTPKIYLTDIDSEHGTLKYLPMDTSKKSSLSLKKLPVISFDSIVFRDIEVYLPDRSKAGDAPSFRDIQLKLTNFLLNEKTLAAQPLLYSEHIDFAMPGFSDTMAGHDYLLEVRNIHGSVSDSLITIDTFTYRPLYSKEEFPLRHPYIQPRLDFRCFNIGLHGLNFTKLIRSGKLTFRSCAASSWSFDFYCDKRRPANPHPPDAILPNDLVRSIPISIDVDSVILNHGYIHWGERWAGSIEPGTLIFNDTRVAAYPFCTDSLDPRFGKETEISFRSLFLGESPVIGLVWYQLHDKALNCKIDATVGTLHAAKLNSELIPNERIEVTEGTATHGIVRMNIKNGFATTTVTPVYHDLSVKVLAKDPNGNRGILEGIKTFLANTFKVRGNNIEEDGKPAVSATTTMQRTRDQEYLQFVWLALRKSLGKVIGFSSPK
jgi:hypothetical protein